MGHCKGQCNYEIQYIFTYKNSIASLDTIGINEPHELPVDIAG